MREVTCSSCGWVAYAITRAQAAENVLRFNAYYETLPPEKQRLYGGPSALDHYVCRNCGGNAFRKSRPGDSPGA